MAREGFNWYAVQVRRRREAVVDNWLKQKGYETFLPVYKAHKQWSDRVKDVLLPLFPGYVFCRFNKFKRLPILTTPNVILVVGNGKEPAPVEESEIAAIARVTKAGALSRPWRYVARGTRVQVIAGPLKGLEGNLLNLNKQYKLILSVTILRRSVAVEVDKRCVAPVRMSLPEALAFASSPGDCAETI